MIREKTKQKILALLRNAKLPISSYSIYKKSNVDWNSLNKFLTELKEKGIISVLKTENGKRFYSLAKGKNE